MHINLSNLLLPAAPDGRCLSNSDHWIDRWEELSVGLESDFSVDMQFLKNWISVRLVSPGTNYYTVFAEKLVRISTVAINYRLNYMSKLHNYI